MRVWNLVGVATLLLAAGVVGLQLRCSVLTARLWDSYLQRRPDIFVDFFPLAQQDEVLIQSAAVLLFLLVLKVRTGTRTRSRNRSSSYLALTNVSYVNAYLA